MTTRSEQQKTWTNLPIENDPSTSSFDFKPRDFAMTTPAAATQQPIVWVPRSLAVGCGVGLSSLHRLMYLVIADRADNNTGLWVWDSRDVAERCGTKDLRTARAGLTALIETGLVQVVADDGRKGVTVRVRPVQPHGRLMVPLAAVWDGAVGGPRVKDNPGGAFTALLGLLYFADFETGRLLARQEKLAEKVGCTRRQFSRNLDSLRSGVGEDVLVEARTRSKGQWGISEYTLVWERLPTYLTRRQIASETVGLTVVDEANVIDLETKRQTTNQILVNWLIDFYVQVGGSRLVVERQAKGWPPIIDALFSDSWTSNHIIDLVAWSRQDPFWSTRVNDLKDVQRLLDSMIARPEFHDWVIRKDRNGHWKFTGSAKAVAKPDGGVAPYPKKVPGPEAYLRASGEGAT